MAVGLAAAGARLWELTLAVRVGCSVTLVTTGAVVPFHLASPSPLPCTVGEGSRLQRRGCHLAQITFPGLLHPSPSCYGC